MAEKKFTHKGETYWVTLDPAIHSITNEGGFIAYVSNKEPEGLYFGALVKNEDGKAIFFLDEFTAFTNAQAIAKSQLGE